MIALERARGGEPRSACLTENQIIDFAAGVLSSDEARLLDGHIDICPTCRLLVSTTVADSGGADVQHGRLGRYELRAVLGRGGMGIVYRAYDPDLDRQVAIKVLKIPERDREEQLQEARALARITHPNVVAVHDVGTVDESVFIAMELVEGEAFHTWRARQPRSRAEILDVMRKVGDGLTAAHAAGLVHGDIKPANIVITPEGRVVVIDFGLATAPIEHGSGGTPGYMAPEQRRHAALDERTDQYGFCVTLFEALFERMPEPNDPELQRRTALARVLARGLRHDMAERFGSMAALLAGLRPRAKLRRYAIATAVVALLGGGIAAYASHDRPDRAPSAPAASEPSPNALAGALPYAQVLNLGAWFLFGADVGSLHADDAPRIVSQFVRARLGSCVGVELHAAQVRYQLHDCDFPLGATLAGDVTVSYSQEGERLVANVTAPSLAVHGITATYDSRAVLERGNGTPEVRITASVDGIGPRGGPYRAKWQTSGRVVPGGCEILDGSWDLTGRAGTMRGSFEQVQLCGAACPLARHAEIVVAGRSVEVAYDGSATARWSTPDGRSGTYQMRCTPR